jgi:light-harvesting complex II chlorophyll a/b binding protein 7
VGAAKAFSGEDLNYLGVAGFRIAGGQGIAIIAICQVRAMSL